MILHIDIKNFAIIKELSLDLAPGLNILTGETGSGKSVIIEAVSMALGSRADSDAVRTGADKALVTLIADAEDADVREDLEAMGAPEDEPLVLMREISRTGRNICRVNGSIVPLSAMNRMCKKLADIHGQYDHQSLLDSGLHIDILDLYGGENLKKARDIAAECYENYTLANSELKKLEKELANSERKRKLLAFESEEIRTASLVPEEDEALEEEIRVMENSEKICSAVSEARMKLFDSELSAEENISSAMSSLGEIADFSPSLSDISSKINDIYYRLDDIRASLRKTFESVNFSEYELNEKVERLDLIKSLKKKFGGSIEEILKYAEKAEEELQNIENADERMSKLKNKINKYREAYRAASEELSGLRKDAGRMLESEISKELSELNFRNSEFSVSIEPSAPSAKGSDRVEFLISTNKGEPLKPLAKIASGGEVSRIMLAMKNIIGDYSNISTMIFDEIDSGISGSAAGAVGEKLLSIAKNRQVICITHLPQIASKGSSHCKIEKLSEDNSTHTTVTPLSPEGRVEEIARLLSGTEITDAARAQARELLG